MKKMLATSHIFIAMAVLLVIMSSGCIQKENDVFCVGNNYSDEDPIKELLKNYCDCLNKRDLNALMNCFDEKINFPDKINTALQITYRGLLYDYKDFFEKIESIGYEFNDTYILISAHTAKVTMKLRKRYRAISPFSYNVDTVVEELVTVTKNDSGVWKVTGMNELLPPRIY